MVLLGISRMQAPDLTLSVHVILDNHFRVEPAIRGKAEWLH